MRRKELAKKIVGFIPSWELPFDTKAQAQKEVESLLQSGNKEYLESIINLIEDFPQAQSALKEIKSYVKGE